MLLQLKIYRVHKVLYQTTKSVNIVYFIKSVRDIKKEYLNLILAMILDSHTKCIFNE